MELYNVFNPIAVEKPVRGREMRTTVIPKETMKAMKVVSTKQLEDEFLKLDNNEMGDSPEIYHEGYIDGKLYLVPDNNLKAMRDIVNKKMKRQQFGNIIQHNTIDKTTKYNEFATKFDTLIEKIDQFAESSSEELKNKVDQDEPQKKLKSAKIKNIINEKEELLNVHEIKFDDDMYASSIKTTSGNRNKYDSVSEDDKINKTDFDYYVNIIPPLLDEKLKYRKVKPNSFETREFEIHALPNTEQYYKENVPEPSQFPDNDSDNWNHPIKDPDSEIFRFLISGHFKSHSSPTFIIHQNYIGPNILENCIPDFKSHKKEGNVHIFITGKFFTRDILVDETITSAAALSIPPYIIPINNKNSIWEEEFKGVYDLGPVDIALEGQFVKDNDTLQYTPIISLDIIKHEPLIKTSEVINTPTTVLYNKQMQISPFMDIHNKNRTRKHVHYATSEQTELQADHFTEEGKHMSMWKNMKNVIKNITSHNLFTKNKNDLDRYIPSTEDIRVSSSQENEVIQSIIKMRKPLDHKQRFRGKSGQSRRNRILEDIRNDKISESKIITLQENNFSETPEKRLSLEQKLSIKKDRSNKNKKKIKKGDKNQAIVENPILAQMQEFFIT